VLRKELDRLTTPPPEAGGDWLRKQVEAINILGRSHKHTIEIFELASDKLNGNAWVNCYMYALSIEPARVNDLCEGDVFPNSKFVAQIIEKKLLVQVERGLSKAHEGDIAIYFDADCKPSHAAITRNGKFVSKWGGRGVLAHVWSHGAYEVPAQYGDDIRLFAPTSNDQIIETYRDWAAAQLEA